MIFEKQKGIPKFECMEYQKKTKDYVVLIPIINEGERISKELKRAKKYQVSEYADIVICDGGSTDGCKNVVKEPFVIINADDYYGKEAFIKLHDFLISENENKEKMNLAMAGFSLKNTLSENGAVTRGVCVADANGYLEKVIETTGIQIVDGKIQCDNAEVSKWITSDAMVSMNMWAGYPDFLRYIDEGFARFLDTLGENSEKKEYLLPNIVAELLEKNLAAVKVLNTSDRWIGITYKEDIEPAQEKFRFMMKSGIYPMQLWE